MHEKTKPGAHKQGPLSSPWIYEEEDTRIHALAYEEEDTCLYLYAYICIRSA